MTALPEGKMGILDKSALLNKFRGPREVICVLKSALTLVGFVLYGPHLLLAQHSSANLPGQREQSGFNTELEIDPIQRPVKLSRAALQALSKDERVASCLENEGLGPERLPANWFIASGIHLDGPHEMDLVVLPGDRLPDTPEGEISQNACLVGANTAQVWILRKTQNGFRLVLSQIAHDLEVLPTKTNGLRDIRLGALVGGYVDMVYYKFDGQSYEIARSVSELSGAELPRTLTGYETRKPLIQLPNQTSEALRAEARAWIWLRWQTHKPSYLKVKTHGNEGDEETCWYFIAPIGTGEWQVTIKVHRIVRANHSSSQSRRSIIEDELLVATQVQRIEPMIDDSHPPRVLSEKEAVPDSKYRLQFLDYGERTVATL